MASYSYLGLLPILTPSLACAWITDNAVPVLVKVYCAFKTLKHESTALLKIIFFTAFLHMKELIKMNTINASQTCNFQIRFILFSKIKYYIDPSLGFPCQENINCDGA